MKHIPLLFSLSLLLLGCSNNPPEKMSENTTAHVDDEGRANLVQTNAEFATEEALDLNDKAMELVRNSEYDEARKYFLKALKIESNNPTILSNLGLIEKVTYHTEEAIAWFNKAIAADSSCYRAYVNYSLLMFEEGKYNKSIELAEYVIKNCDDADVTGSAYFNAALSLSENDDCVKARDYFNKFVTAFNDADFIQQQKIQLEDKLNGCEYRQKNNGQ
ncbi:MAG: tetratricopeptide repeat protein [Flavobacteriales bacterium]